MPIYELYCRDCHRIFNFLSRRIDTEKRPDCPRCGHPRLERPPSLFGIWKGGKEVEGEEGMPEVDDSKLERAMSAMAGELDGIDENDPRQAAHLMRRLYETAGLPVGPGVAEALARMEAGEDPDQIEHVSFHLVVRMPETGDYQLSVNLEDQGGKLQLDPVP